MLTKASQEVIDHRNEKKISENYTLMPTECTNHALTIYHKNAG